jgi:hypothetical protein
LGVGPLAQFKQTEEWQEILHAENIEEKLPLSYCIVSQCFQDLVMALFYMVKISLPGKNSWFYNMYIIYIYITYLTARTLWVG